MSATSKNENKYISNTQPTTPTTPTTPSTPLAKFYFYDDNETGVVINSATPIHSCVALDIIDIEKQQNQLNINSDSPGIIYDIFNILKSVSRNIVILIRDLKM